MESTFFSNNNVPGSPMSVVGSGGINGDIAPNHQYYPTGASTYSHAPGTSLAQHFYHNQSSIQNVMTGGYMESPELELNDGNQEQVSPPSQGG